MKTLLISPMWLDYDTGMLRHTKWLDFMLPLKNKLGFDEVFFTDNASDPTKISQIRHQYNYQLNIHSCTNHLPRREHLKYPYWYSALAIAARHAIEKNFNKIIYIDTDIYPLSNRLCEYTKNIKTGWTILWCHRHKFPESNYQIIGEDKIHTFHEWMSRDFLSFYPDKDAESQIPATHVEKGFVGDRYGEENNGLGIDQTPEMDYYGQCPVTRKLVFNG